MKPGVLAGGALLLLQVCRILNLIHQKIVCKESVKSSSLHETHVNSGINEKKQTKQREVQKVKMVSGSSGCAHT